MSDVKEYQCTLKVTDAKGTVVFDGKGSLNLEKEFLRFIIPGKKGYMIRYRDLDELVDDDYTMLMATSKIRFAVSMLGKFYRGLLEEIGMKRRDDTIHGLLLDDFREIDEFTAEYTHINGSGKQIACGRCEVLVFDRAVLVWPEDAINDFMKVFYSDILQVMSSDIALRLELEDDEVITFSMMGKRLPAAHKAIIEQRESHITKLRQAVSTAFPGLNEIKVNSLVELFKEGLAVPVKKLEEVDPSVTRIIDEGISTDDELKDAYDFLLEMGTPGEVYAGIQVEKFGLDDQEPTYWFLIGQTCGVVAMEVTSQEGHATYFFHSAGRDGDTGAGIRELGRALVDLRFRRTPIYLSDDELKEKENARYAFAAQRLPCLREVRRRFVGRVAHRSKEGWRKSVENLLAWCNEHPEGGRIP